MTWKISGQMVTCDDECMMCSGEACRYCGAGCWDSSVTNCNHDILERHEWNPVLAEYRAELIRKEMEAIKQ